MNWDFGKGILDFGKGPVVMGILNVTPDSFSDGGSYVTLDKAIRQASAMLEAGAAIIDVGGESTRPGYEPVPEDVEKGRVLPVVKALAVEFPEVPVSIDTMKPAVAEAALCCGASIVNDVSSLEYGGGGMLEVVAGHGAGCVIMHSGGLNGSLSAPAQVADVLEGKLRRAVAETGLSDEHFVFDPGIGFGKDLEQNLALTCVLEPLLDRPVLIGPSRKSYLGRITGRDVGCRLGATLAAVSIAAFCGASILRVHDVGEAADAVAVATALRCAREKTLKLPDR